jgi:hypothetical protein
VLGSNGVGWLLKSLNEPETATLAKVAGSKAAGWLLKSLNEPEVATVARPVTSEAATTPSSNVVPEIKSAIFLFFDLLMA